jgi:hypothetical protein
MITHLNLFKGKLIGLDLIKDRLMHSRFLIFIESYDNWRMVALSYPIIEISNFDIANFKVCGCKTIINMIWSILSMINEQSRFCLFSKTFIIKLMIYTSDFLVP